MVRPDPVIGPSRHMLTAVRLRLPMPNVFALSITWQSQIANFSSEILLRVFPCPAWIFTRARVQFIVRLVGGLAISLRWPYVPLFLLDEAYEVISKVLPHEIAA